MSRKYDAIDLMKLYSQGSNNGWNEFLTECYGKSDINKLAKVKYQIAVGMTDLANGKLNTPDIDVWFVRLNRSLELTAKRIIKFRNPLPGDNPLIAMKTRESVHDIKKKRDGELAKFMRDSSF